MTAKLPLLTRIAVLALACLAGGPALSETRTCRQLEADFASASGVSPEAGRYDDAILTQRDQLQIAQGRGLDAGCGSGRGRAQCAGIYAQIEKMERNLDALQRKRARLAEGGSVKARARIAAELVARGCHDEAVADARPSADRDGNKRLLDQVFLNGIALGEPDGDVAPSAEDEPEMTRPSDIYRIFPPQDGVPVEQNVFSFPPPIRQVEALCVRTCDGYLFPMSNGNGFADPSSDQKSCESSCPGTEVEVYYREQPGDDAQSLVSAASGMPYSELPAAYLFKKTGVPQPPNCSCNPPRTFKVMSTPSAPATLGEPAEASGDESRIKMESGSIMVIAPPAEKPATPASEPAPKAAESGSTDADKKVRVVGPVFLPDPSEAIDLQAPAPHPVR